MELLVVVSIIALLISILLPSLKSARDQAKTIKCLAHTRGLAQSAMVFSGDHGDRMQLSAVEINGNYTVGVNAIDPDRRMYDYDSFGELLSWPVALARSSSIGFIYNWDWGPRAVDFETALSKKSQMSEGFGAAMCPADRVRISTPNYPLGDGLKGTGDPEDPQGAGQYWGYLSYGISEDITGTEFKTNSQGEPSLGCWKDGVQGENDNGSAQGGERLRGNMDRIWDPATCLLIADAGPNSMQEALDGEFDSNAGNGYANLILSAQAPGPLLAHSVWQWYQRIPTKRHPGGQISVTFADFHASAVKPIGWRPRPDIGPDFKVPAAYNKRVRVSPYRPDG